MFMGVGPIVAAADGHTLFYGQYSISNTGNHRDYTIERKGQMDFVIAGVLQHHPLDKCLHAVPFACSCPLLGQMSNGQGSMVFSWIPLDGDETRGRGPTDPNPRLPTLQLTLLPS